DDFCSVAPSISNSGAAMHRALGRVLTAAVFVGCALSAKTGLAADLGLVTKAPVGTCSELVFSCENGRQYPLCPIAVTVAGEVVTASLHTGYGGAPVGVVSLGGGDPPAGGGGWGGGVSAEGLLGFCQRTPTASTTPDCAHTVRF